MSLMTATAIARSLGFVLILILSMHGEARTQEQPDFTEMLKVARVSTPLSGEERALAVRLAEQTMRSNKLLPERKTFLTLVQTHRNGEAEKKGSFERHALLTYYRYAGDTGILVYVNLVRQRVIKVEQIPRFPAPFAPEEVQKAKALALDHPQLRKVLEPYRERLIVEVLLTRSPDRRDPRFRHRLAYLLFRVGPRYLTAQGEVLADLTTETLIIQPAQERQGDGHKH
jgi:hypothetical protein